MQRDQQLYNVRSWLTKALELAGKKRNNRPRSGSIQGLDDVVGLLNIGFLNTEGPEIN
jgi:hypothetical protein